jgi:hypothetical protein
MASGNKQRAAEVDAATRERDATLAAARTPSPVETYMNDRTLKTLQSIDSAHDVSDIYGISPYLDMFNRAKTGEANQHNVGTASMGDAYANPNLLAQQRQDRQAEREENASGMLENAVAGIKADATGSAMPLIQSNLQRNSMLLNSSDNRFGAARQANNQPGWFQNMLGQWVHGAGQGAGAAMAGGEDGGDLTPYLGGPVLVGEAGPEPVVTPDGRATVVGTEGPEKIVPLEPMTVVPNRVAHALDFNKARDKRRLREAAARYSQKPAEPSAWWHDPDAPVRVIRPAR